MDLLTQFAHRWRQTIARNRPGDVGKLAESPAPPEALALLRHLTGNPTATFRHHQWEVIDALVHRHERLFLIQRTGWGKSAVYFISAKLLRERGGGPTIIVSPLLSLMRNQVLAGRRMGLRIGALHSGTSHHFEAFRQGIQKDEIDVLLVAPERFANQRFRDHILPLLAQKCAMLVVDEAHCISEWGHDFRFEYLRLGSVVASLPAGIPLLATTATVNERVMIDVEEQLGRLRIIQGPLVRENLALQVLAPMAVAARFAWLASTIPTLPGQGIVYTLTTGDANTVAAWLRHRGINAHAYHAALGLGGRSDNEDRRRDLERRFSAGELKVLVATSALGMGYDHAGIRFVIHYQTPASMLSYYQQVGRAGRGRDVAIGILMGGPEDEEIHQSLRTNMMPTIDERAWVVAAVKKKEPALATELLPLVNLPLSRIEHTLRFLSAQTPPLVSPQGELWTSNRVLWDTSYGARREALGQANRAEWEEMVRFRRPSRTCIMHTLLRALGEPSPTRRCGRCANCRGTSLVSQSDSTTLRAEAEHFLNQPATTPIPPRRRIPAGGLPDNGFSGEIPPSLLACDGKALTRWGNVGLGPMIDQGKRMGRFDETLVDAAVTFITESWHPMPAPVWVTCVPSLRHPDLVPDLAQRIADKLDLPFMAAVTKIRDVEPQKRQENDIHQCRNLDRAFAVSENPDPRPVLLIDDMVDSGWTFTVIAMLLRRAGSGPVIPFALASTRRGEP